MEIFIGAAHADLTGATEHENDSPPLEGKELGGRGCRRASWRAKAPEVLAPGGSAGASPSQSRCRGELFQGKDPPLKAEAFFPLPRGDFQTSRLRIRCVSAF